jgi:hypothetical protein
MKTSPRFEGNLPLFLSQGTQGVDHVSPPIIPGSLTDAAHYLIHALF